MVKKNINNSQETDKKKCCFIITPLGEEKSETRRRANGVIEAVLRPVLESLEIEMITPHGISSPGSIPQQVIQNILSCELVIANLTELNPNVMYELAVRHAKGTPVICIAEHGTKLPFDISSERTIFYNNDMYGVESLKPQLKNMIEVALKDKNNDNPIYRADRDFKLREAVKKEGNNDFSYLLDKIEALDNKVSLLYNKDDCRTIEYISEVLKGNYNDLIDIESDPIFTQTGRDFINKYAKRKINKNK